MGEVVEFPVYHRVTYSSPEIKVWTCGCGGQLWYLTPEGECICVDCEHRSACITVTEVESNGSQG